MARGQKRGGGRGVHTWSSKEGVIETNIWKDGHQSLTDGTTTMLQDTRATLIEGQSTTKQNKTKQNKTKQNKTKQNKTKQNKTKQNKTKQNNPSTHVHLHSIEFIYCCIAPVGSDEGIETFSSGEFKNNVESVFFIMKVSFCKTGTLDEKDARCKR